jgi:hypothetical protein
LRIGVEIKDFINLWKFLLQVVHNGKGLSLLVMAVSGSISQEGLSVNLRYK